MSHTLNRLKQSEIDHGLRKPTGKKTKSSQGLYIAFFVITVSLFIVIINFRDLIFSVQKQTPSRDMIATSSKKAPTISLNNQQSKPTVDNKTEAKKEDLLTEKKTNTISQLEKATDDITDQQIAYFSNRYETLEGNIALKETEQDNRLTKEELKITLSNNKTKDLSDKKVSTFEDQLTLQQEIQPDYENQPVLWQDLNTNFKKRMPEMVLNGITFLEKEEDRFVFINMNKYQLDDLVEKGPSIEEIRKDSVVMFYENKRFILPLHM